MPNLHDQYLVLQVVNRQDRAAFGELYEQYAELIRRFIRLRVSRVEDADDLAAEVFVKAWNHLTRMKSDAVLPTPQKVNNFRAYVYKIARNEVIDFYRAQGRIPQTISLDEPEYPIDIADTREDPFLQQLAAFDRTFVIDCVKKLQEGYRDVLTMRYLDELSMAEIADIIGKTKGNVRVLIHRGVKALRTAMDKEQAQGKFL